MFCARCNKPLPKIDMPTVRCPGCMLVNIIPGKGPMLGIPGALPALQQKKARKWPRLAAGTVLGLLIVLAIIGCQPKAPAPEKAKAAELPPVKAAEKPKAPELPAAQPQADPVKLPDGQVKTVAWKGSALDLCGMDSTGLVGKLVEVTGDVRAVNKSGYKTYVELQGDADAVWVVNCRFLEDQKATGRVTIQGIVKDGSKQGSVQLDRCKLK